MAIALAVALLIASIQGAMALTGTYIYANDGSYFSTYGTPGYWHITNSQGFCGQYGSCSPYSARWTYTNGTYQDNSAKWDNIDSAQNGSLAIFIPDVNATTTSAPYLATYNGASSYPFRLNQNIYYDQWVPITTLYDIRNVWLGDNTGESAGSTQVGFDEVRIIY